MSGRQIAVLSMHHIFIYGTLPRENVHDQTVADLFTVDLLELPFRVPLYHGSDRGRKHDRGRSIPIVPDNKLLADGHHHVLAQCGHDVRFSIIGPRSLGPRDERWTWDIRSLRSR